MIFRIKSLFEELTSDNPITSLLNAFRSELVGVAIFSFVANMLTLTPTIYMLQVFDRFVKSKSGSTLVAVSLIALFFFVIMAFAEWMRSRVLVRAGVRFDEKLNSKVFSASFQNALFGKNINPTEAFSDLTNLRQFMTGNGIHALFDLPWVPVYMLVAYLLHPLLGLLTFLFVVILLFVFFQSHLQNRRTDRPLMEANLVTARFVQAKLRNAEAIEAMGMVDGLRAKWKTLHRKQLLLNADVTDRAELVQSLIKFLQYSVQSLALAAGALLVIDGELTAGAMVAATLLVGRACQPVQLVVASWRGSLAAMQSYERLVDLLRSDDKQAKLQVPDGFQAKLEVRNLSAFVDGREDPILNGCSFAFKRGEMVAVVGPSGSGKSTFVRCVLGLWERTSGEVYLDGAPINEWDRGQLGKYVGYLPQDVELFDGTMADNICRFGHRDPQLIIAAARAAGVHEMILRFPEGYDTQMGFAGSFLSGGQRQRLALARAIYGDPELIVLDEPNANLDDAGEAALMASITRLKEAGRTVIFVSHRPSVLKFADRVVRFDSGNLVLLRGD